MKGVYSMEKRAIQLILLSLFLAGVVWAKSPIRYVDSRSIGVEFESMWRGQTITEVTVPSHDQFWQVAVNYAPLEYVQFLVGIGAQRFKVDTYQNATFNGNYGFTFSAGAYANSPAFINKIFRFTAGCDAIYLNCKDDYDYKYSGPIVDPLAGFILCAGRYVEFELGGMGHFIIGEMENPRTKSTSEFSNNEYVKGYLDITATSPAGIYATLHFDGSQNIGKDWENGPYEAGIGFNVGVILRDKRPKQKKKKEKSKYFPEYDDMKEKQDDLFRDIE